MNVVVCLKQILDPEISPQEFRIDAAKKEAAQGNASLVISPFDENALEVALQIRDRAGGGKVTAISIGGASAVMALRKALAVKADEAVHIATEQRVDSFSAARILSAALNRLSFDLVICGRQAGDWDFGIVGSLLAEALGVPCVPFVMEAEEMGDAIKARQQTIDGYAIVKAPLPAVLTVTNASTNVLRYPKVRDMMLADRKEIAVWDVSALVDGKVPESPIEIKSLYIPMHEVECEMLEGDSAAQKAVRLAQRMRELKLV